METSVLKNWWLLTFNGMFAYLKNILAHRRLYFINGLIGVAFGTILFIRLFESVLVITMLIGAYIAASIFGVLAGVGGITHGIGEMLQCNIDKIGQRLISLNNATST